MKEQIGKALKKVKHRIVIIIDDLDRLSAEEIRQVFRLIKIVADFPNVVYVVAFDREVAVQALAATPGISGEDYLEKIIQISLELPTPDI